jgi:hypothetical protein
MSAPRRLDVSAGSLRGSAGTWWSSSRLGVAGVPLPHGTPTSSASGVRLASRAKEGRADARVATEMLLTKAEQVSDDGGAPPDHT